MELRPLTAHKIKPSPSVTETGIGIQRAVFHLPKWHLGLTLNDHLSIGVAIMASLHFLQMRGTGRIRMALSLALALQIAGCASSVDVRHIEAEDSFIAVQKLQSSLYALAAAVAGDAIYISGGNGPLAVRAAIDRYDPRAANQVTVADSPIPRRDHTAETVDGTIYIIGGATPIPAAGGFRLFPSMAVESYNTATGELRSVAFMHVGRRRPGSAAYGGKIYVMGGSSITIHPEGRVKFLRSMEIYDPKLDTWTRGPDMPTARALSAVAWEGKIYAIGGFNGHALRTFEVYDIATAEWASLPDMPIPLRAHSCVVLDGKIYSFGDYRYFQMVARYDIDSGEWTVLDSNYKRARYTAAVVWGEKILVIGGNTSELPSSGRRTVQLFTPPKD